MGERRLIVFPNSRGEWGRRLADRDAERVGGCGVGARAGEDDEHALAAVVGESCERELVEAGVEVAAELLDRGRGRGAEPGDLDRDDHRAGESQLEQLAAVAL